MAILEPESTQELPPRGGLRLAGLVIVGALLIGAFLYYNHYWLARPIGEGPAGPAVPIEPFDSTWSERPVLLLGLGDSITAGFGASRPDLSFFARLAKNPADEFPEMQGRALSAVFPKFQAQNEAISGSNSIQHLESIEQMRFHDAEVLGVVVLTTGGNDLIHWYGRQAPHEGAMYGATLKEALPWIAAFEQRLNTMIDFVGSKFPGGCQIFLGDIYDPTDGVGDGSSVYLPDWPDGLAILAAYNEILRRCAEQRDEVHLVPIHDTFLGHGSHSRQYWREHYRAEDPHYWYYHNIEDPNDRGYDALRRIFLLEMAGVFAAESLGAAH